MGWFGHVKKCRKLHQKNKLKMDLEINTKTQRVLRITHFCLQSKDFCVRKNLLASVTQMVAKSADGHIRFYK